MFSESLIQIISGGTAGIVSATVTSPLDVVKTRLQSSQSRGVHDHIIVNASSQKIRRTALRFAMLDASKFQSMRLLSPAAAELYLRQIAKCEGISALWKGLLPTLVGIVPSRAIYFCAYSHSKKAFESVFDSGTTPVHVCSAACSGFVTTTFANPIWMVRTRMQLDHGAGACRMNVRNCILQIYREFGFRGFLKGVTASYAGLTETVLHFGVYEKLKSVYLAHQSNQLMDSTPTMHFPLLMLFGAIARLIASCMSYPHEVVRTRLREKASHYHGFFSTLVVIYRLESWRGLYSGLSVHLMKTVPNSAFLMATYELTLYLLKGQT
uniref:Mitochondrial carrier protein n=1 Tax=Trichuris muris TaxID=70415 RepID=A0A5S6Q5V8_TRIMR